MKFIEDKRAQRYIDICDQFENVKQVNINRCSNAFTTPEWHAHKVQEDVFFCIKGSFLIGLASHPRGLEAYHLGIRDGWKVEFVVLSDRQPQSLNIPTETFHCYMPLEPDSFILFGMKEKYDPKDLFVLPAGFFGESWDLKK